MNFDQAFELVVGHEGVYSTDRNDPGNYTPSGEFKGTKYGISARSYPHLDIKNLTLEDAKAIYKKDFWDAIRAEELPESLRFHLFDYAVNSGVSRAIIGLQRVLGVADDGIFGPITMLSLQNHKAHIAWIALMLSLERLEFMTQRVIWDTQGKGWTRRMIKNMRMILTGK